MTRPAISRFKTHLNYRTYSLIRHQLTFTPKEAQRSHRLNKRLDGAFHGQQPFPGALSLGIFTFLKTFRRACDAAGLTHGQALPLMVLRLAGNAKMAFSGALNSTLGRKRYAIPSSGDAVNWLRSKEATRNYGLRLPRHHYDKATRQQGAHSLCHRVETQCDLLNGFFDIQDVKDVFITGLSDLVQAHVRVFNNQFPDRTLSEIVDTAQMYSDSTNKLRLQLKMTRPTAVEVAYATQDQRTTTERPFTPVRTPPPPRAAVPQANRADICYNCDKPGHSPHSVPNHIALASLANRLSAFMPLPTVTSKKTRSNIRPTPWTTGKTPKPGARLGVARRNARAYGNKSVAPCLTALRHLRQAWPVHAGDAELPPCTSHGRRGEHSAN